MDSIFLLDEGARTNFLQQLVLSSGCTYICLWTFYPQPSNCLIFMDGFYNEESNQPSSSSGSLARRLFDQYRQSLFPLQNDTVPGLAFNNSRPYIELKDSDLQRLASTEPQLQFYQEAKIKSAIFMGCKTGEIELGTSNDRQANLEMEMRNWFPEDFLRQNPRPSSSSSSLRSLSMDSPECSPFLFNMLSNSYINPEPPKEAQVHHQTFTPIPTTTNPLQEAMQALSRVRNVQFPTIESENAAMTNAILAVISSSSSPSPSSSSSYQPKKSSAFKNYRSSLAPSTQMVTTRARRQNMLKRSITFFRRLNLIRAQDQQVQGSRPTSTQLHHMISERRRREKLNDSFQVLRSFLPPGSKKDKASVLSSTTEYMNSLKAQIEELTQRNQFLEAQVLSQKEATNEDQLIGSTSNERINVLVRDIGESTSEAQNIELQVSLRGECNLLDLAIRIMEFLKQVKTVKLISVEANTRMIMIDSSPINRVVLRLKIDEGGDWDKSAFQEAVRRVVADLAQ